MQKVLQLIGRKAQSDVERAEQAVNRAGFIEAHLVNEFLENQRVIGEEIDSPFPIIEADRTRNDLIDAAGIWRPIMPCSRIIRCRSRIGSLYQFLDSPRNLFIG